MCSVELSFKQVLLWQLPSFSTGSLIIYFHLISAVQHCMSTFLSRITCPILSHKTRDSYCHRGTLQPIQWSASGRPNTSPHNCCVLRLPSPPENSRSWLRLLVSIIIASQTVNPQLFVGYIVFDPSSSSSMDDKPHAGRCAWFTKMLWCRQSGRRWGHCDPAIIVFNGKSYYECDELSI